MTTYKIIVNPVSGRGAGAKKQPIIESLLQKHGLDYHLVRTERPWHAAELAQQAATEGYGVVVAVGGDGTANEVLNGLMLARETGAGDGAALGVLCVGRGNDLAYGLGLPRDVAEACRILAQGQRRLVDVGRVVGGLYPQGRYFGNGVGIGFDAVVGFEALKLTWLHGFASYLIAALKTILLFSRAPLVRLEYGDCPITQPALMISIMNGRRMGGGFLMAPQARIDDGLLDLCVAGEVNRAGILALLPRFVRGTQAGHAAIRNDRLSRIAVTALEGVLPAHADGETLCTTGQRLEIEILPGQLEVVCGCDAAEAGR
ncbi:MAG: diacylglycerol/lipid kinase family protein [Chloroflexota bacterium]